ncbi:MAG: hypothetical protein HY332_20195 [Chloroflexi bacterium]|nr:hypothetical protein [Chloroflexota bacterium]
MAANPFARVRSLGLSSLLNGKDPLPRVVAVETDGADGIVLYVRNGDGTVETLRDAVRPWLILNDASLGYLPVGEHEVETLAGDRPLNRLVRFARWAQLARAQAALSAAGAQFLAYTSLVAQYLAITGRTLFQGMRFDDLHRLQLDIETSSLRPEAPDASVLVVALTDNRGYEEVLSARDGGEAELLRRLNVRVAALDPDVVEGHNITDFDLPYLAARARRLGVALTWGRDGRPVWLQEREGRLKVGARLLPSMRVRINGRHILDTYQQIQRFDSEGKLESYALKTVIESLELTRADREFVDRTDINALWQTDPERLARYCLDDARDVRTLSELITPTEFYQAQLVPRSFQDVATGGTGEKINALLIRAYLAARESIPLPQAPRPYPGGYLELRATGVFRHVAKCDVESLYPALMLHFGYRPASESLGVFLPTLRALTEQRLHAKRQIARTSGPERSYWSGLSSSYKVLINCFTPGHQVLTPDGFRTVEDLRVGDVVYSLNPETGTPEVKAVTHTWEYDYDGSVIVYRHDNVDVEVTPNHRFILQDHRDRFTFREAWELPQLTNHLLPAIPSLATVGEGGEASVDLLAHVPDASETRDGRLWLRRKTQTTPRHLPLNVVLRLIGWYASEGSLFESTPRAYPGTFRGLTRRVTLYQRLNVNPVYHQEIIDLLQEIGLRFRADAAGISFSSDVLYRFLEEQCGKGSMRKRLPLWVFALPQRSLELLWQTLMKGDGDRDHPRFTTKSPQLRDDFCRLCYLLGKRVTVSFDGCYRIWVKRERRVSLRGRQDQFTMRHHAGKVFCVTIADNHTLLAGRNYKLNWIGQSFYGYLGYGRANFNDFDAAEAVTTTGQKLIKDVLAALEAHGCRIIEVDTDGVYFVPGDDVGSESDELALVEAVGRVLPEGINLAHDGRYAGMVSLKQKTYFLLTYDGRLIARGSSLRSRRDERYLREFVQKAAVTLIERSIEDVSARYLEIAAQIQEGRLPVEDFCRHESITSKTFTSPGLKRLAAAAKGVQVGQKVAVYQRRDGSLALTSEYEHDEDRDYLLRRLHDMAKRFESLCADRYEFQRLFPKLTTRQPAMAERPVQLSLF